MNRLLPLILTDLDGSLLDHHSYDFEPARPLIEQLKQLAVPVIPCTSKTQSEVEHLRDTLGLTDPYVVENGAAIVVTGFSKCSDSSDESKHESNHELTPDTELDVIELSMPRSHWLDLLASLKPEFGEDFQTFADAGDAGVMAMTGLDLAAAHRANTRDYSEPVAWLGDDQTKQDFVARLQQLNAHVLQGGRFLAVGGDCDKGRALKRLQSEYQSRYPDRQVVSLAIGDSANDIAMLEAADEALVIRSPAHAPPVLQRSDGVTVSRKTGPHGWDEGVRDWLRRLGIQIEAGSFQTPVSPFNRNPIEQE